MGRVTTTFGLHRVATLMLIIDMISDYRFPEGPAVLQAAQRIAPRIARLKERAASGGIPCAYLNDNIGRWRSDLGAILAHCAKADVKVAELLRTLGPGPQDLVILKPRHSAFYATPLSSLIEEAGVRRVILTGVSAQQCILFTANDAHLRNLELCIPQDCVAAANSKDSRFAVKYFQSVLGADIRQSTRLRLR
jgi:nicotinamidase-related amidase